MNVNCFAKFSEKAYFCRKSKIYEYNKKTLVFMVKYSVFDESEKMPLTMEKIYSIILE